MIAWFAGAPHVGARVPLLAGFGALPWWLRAGVGLVAIGWLVWLVARGSAS